MTPDDLDDVLRRSLGSGDGAPPPASDLDDLVARGQARRRRRQTGLAGVAAAVVLLGGLTFAARRSGPDAGPAGPAPTATAPTSVPVTTGAPGPTSTTTPVRTGAPPAATAIDAVAQRGSTLYLVTGGTSGPTETSVIESVDACAGVTETPCDVPVVAVAPDLWFLRRTPTRRELVHHHGGVDEVVRTGDIVDFSVGPNGRPVVLSRDGVLVETGPSGDDELDRGVKEVVATYDGRMAWVTADGLAVRAPDGARRTIALSFGPSQLSFAPTGPLLLARMADGRRAVVDTASDEAAPLTTFDATAACWGETDATIWSYDGAADREGQLTAVNPRTGATVPFGGEALATAQIACTPSGAVAYVDPGGVLVRTWPGTGRAAYAFGGFERVRSVR